MTFRISNQEQLSEFNNYEVSDINKKIDNISFVINRKEGSKRSAMNSNLTLLKNKAAELKIQREFELQEQKDVAKLLLELGDVLLKAKRKFTSLPDSFFMSTE